MKIFLLSPFIISQYIPMYKSFILLYSSSRYLYQLPFSSMKQKLTKKHIFLRKCNGDIWLYWCCICIHDCYHFYGQSYILKTRKRLFLTNLGNPIVVALHFLFQINLSNWKIITNAIGGILSLRQMRKSIMRAVCMWKCLINYMFMVSLHLRFDFDTIFLRTI